MISGGGACRSGRWTHGAPSPEDAGDESLGEAERSRAPTFRKGAITKDASSSEPPQPSQEVHGGAARQMEIGPAHVFSVEGSLSACVGPRHILQGGFIPPRDMYDHGLRLVHDRDTSAKDAVGPFVVLGGATKERVLVHGSDLAPHSVGKQQVRREENITIWERSCIRGRDRGGHDRWDFGILFRQYPPRYDHEPFVPNPIMETSKPASVHQAVIVSHRDESRPDVTQPVIHRRSDSAPAHRQVGGVETAASKLAQLMSDLLTAALVDHQELRRPCLRDGYGLQAIAEQRAAYRRDDEGDVAEDLMWADHLLSSYPLGTSAAFVLRSVPPRMSRCVRQPTLTFVSPPEINGSARRRGRGSTPASSTDWLAYFDRLEHHSPLYREQSALYVEALTASVGVHRDQRVLDFGCGFGFVVAMLAPLVAEVWFWDPSPHMRSMTERNTAHLSNTRFCDLSTPPSTEPERTTWHGPPFDLIIVNSVAQYMAPDELSAWLARWRGMLAPGGKLVLSDLIPSGHSGVSDVADLLRLGARHGSPLRAAAEALGGLRHYWQTSRAVPLVRVGPEDLERAAAGADLATTALPHNLTHFSKRWTAVLLPRSRQGMARAER